MWTEYCAVGMNADRANRFPPNTTTFACANFKTGIGCRPYLLETSRHRRLSWLHFEPALGYRALPSLPQQWPPVHYRQPRLSPRRALAAAWAPQAPSRSWRWRSWFMGCRPWWWAPD